MNGVHDLGGMQDMGPIQYERNEPVYHAEWESRVDAMTQALRGKVPGGPRQGIEKGILGADYLRMSYYERWYESLVWRLLAARVATRDEIDSGRSAAPKTASTRAYSAAEAIALMAQTQSTRQSLALAPRFQVGQRVRARNINPVGYTRLPRYARGRLGIVDRLRGVFPLPDDGAGGKPQNLYSIRFPSRELWGEQSSLRDAVYIDMWDDYLEAA
jgi:nitrile hydratase